MNKSESKYFNTALLMDEALLQLLEKKDFAFISVKEICQKAGVNRSTFYLHYENTNELLEETIERLNERFVSSFPKDLPFSMRRSSASYIISYNCEYYNSLGKLC